MGFLNSLFGKGIDALMEEARATPGAVVLDVRSPQEFADGHIPEAINIPLDRIDQAARRVNMDQPLFVYCLSGARSAQACRMLAHIGFANTTDMGGINRWTGPIA